MSSYKQTDVFNKILTLEDKVDRLEEIISYGDSEKYRFTKTPYYYKSAVKLSNATRHLKEDLLQNPCHNNLDRDDYQQIYNRVRYLEKELNNILYDMNFGNRDRPTPKSNYNHVSNMDSSSMLDYDEPTFVRGCDLPPKRRIIQRKPQTKHVSYNRYVTVIPSDTSSSESVEEIIYYIESPTSSSSSSTSVIIEEYVPKKYTRRSVRRSPIIDVSKSRPKSSVRESVAKSTTKHKRKTPSERSTIRHPKVKKTKKDKKTLQVSKSKSTSEISDKKSQIYLVKRSKESPKNINKTENQGKKERFFVSRLKKVKSSDEEEKTSSENEPNKNKKSAAKSKSKSKNQETKLRGKSDKNKTNHTKFKKNYKRRLIEKPQSAERSTDTVIVAHSSFILNDPFVHTIYYNDIDSMEEENNTSLLSNDDGAFINSCRVKEKCLSNKSKSERENGSRGNIHKASKYEISNSFYSFDPFTKRKEKFYRTNKLNRDNFSSDVNDNSAKNNARIYNGHNNYKIVLNVDKLESQQNIFPFKTAKNSRDKGKTIPCKQIEKDRPNAKNEKPSSCVDDKNNTYGSSNMPIAHSVYLTTIPIYQTSLDTHDLKLGLPFYTPISTEKITETNIKKNKNSEIVKITSHHGMILEDEILMNVAKKLSPVVAKMINSGYHKSKDESKAKLISSTKNSNSEKYIISYLFDRNGSLSKVVDRPNHSKQSLLLPGKGKKEKDYRKGKCNKSGENEIFTKVVNSYDENIMKPVIKSHIYTAELENNSPLQQKPSTKKSTLKKLKSLTSVKSLFRKKSEEKSEKGTMGKQSDNIIQNRESNEHNRTGSWITETKKPEMLGLPNDKPYTRYSVYEGSQDNLKDIRSISQYNQHILNPIQSTLERESPSEEEEERLRSRLENFPSLEAKSIQKQKSILKNTNQENRIKSSSRFKNLLKKISSKEKVPKNTQPKPALKNLLTMMKTQDKLSKKVENRQSQEAQIPSEVQSWQDSEQDPAFLNRIKSHDKSSKIFNQEQIQGTDKQSQYYSRHGSVENRNQTKIAEYNEPEVHDLANDESDLSIYDGSQAYLKNVRSVSQYEQHKLSPEQIFSADIDFETKATNLSLAPEFQPEEIMVESLRKNTLNQQGNVEGIETAIGTISLEKSPLHDSSERSRVTQEVQDKKLKETKNPLHFCIHFSKEKRSKFESQSTLSLDSILLSQCKKVYSSEDLSLSEYAFDGKKESYISRKKHPKNNKNEGIHSVSINDCCCKKTKVIKSEQFISDSSYYSLNWHKIANEIKQPN